MPRDGFAKEAERLLVGNLVEAGQVDVLFFLLQINDGLRHFPCAQPVDGEIPGSEIYKTTGFFEGVEVPTAFIKTYKGFLGNVLCYIAILGYLLRYKPIKKILTVIAVLIVAICIYREIDSLIQKHVQKTNTISQQTVSATYEEIDRIKETARQNRENEIE